MGSSRILIGERSISNTIDGEIYTSMKSAQSKQALEAQNWGAGALIPDELEKFSVTVKKSRPRTANPRVRDVRKKGNTLTTLGRDTNKASRPLSAYSILEQDDKCLPQVVHFTTASSTGQSRRLDNLVKEVDDINAKNYKKRLRLFRYYKERQWHVLMRLATVMAKVRQDSDQGQRMFLALSSGFAASTSAHS